MFPLQVPQLNEQSACQATVPNDLNVLYAVQLNSRPTGDQHAEHNLHIGNCGLPHQYGHIALSCIFDCFETYRRLPLTLRDP